VRPGHPLSGDARGGGRSGLDRADRPVRVRPGSMGSPGTAVGVGRAPCTRPGRRSRLFGAPCGYLARWVGSGPASGYWLAVAACWASCASQSPPAIGGRRERRLQRSSRERWIASPSRPGRVAVGAGWCGSPGQATAPGLRCGGVTVSRRRRGRGQAASRPHGPPDGGPGTATPGCRGRWGRRGASGADDGPRTRPGEWMGPAGRATASGECVGHGSPSTRPGRCRGPPPGPDPPRHPTARRP
jgi:hypothetical protein